MSGYFSQFLYFADEVGYLTEFVNGSRTAANLRASNNARFSNVDQFAGCRALKYAPSTITVTPPSTISCQAWDPMVYTQAAAPWYSDWGIAPPGTVYGLYITDVTGLDGEHYKRTTTALASGRGGARYGHLRSDGRVCKFNVQLLGATEIDLEHLFRWMEVQLNSCCDIGGNMIFRRYCPDLAGYDDGSLAVEANTGILTAGLTMAKGGVLLEGPTWENPISEDSGCVIRTASFTIGFSDPCLYVVDETLGTTTFVDMTAGSFTALVGSVVGDAPLPAQANPLAWTSLAAMPAYPISVVRTRSDYIGTASAIVTLSSNAERYVDQWKRIPDMRISTYLPIAAGGTNPALAHRVSEVVLANVASGAIVEVNMHTHTVRQRASFDTNDWSDASGYLRRISGVPRWAGVSCNGAFIRVEPLSIDSTKALRDAGRLASGYTVNVLPGTRFGCAC